MQWMLIAPMLMSVAANVICISTILRQKKWIKDMEESAKRVREEREKELSKCEEEVYELRGELKKVNEENFAKSLENCREEFEKEYDDFRGYWITLKDGKDVKERYVEEIAKMMLKMVAEAVPDDLRTYEVIKMIISYMSKGAENAKITMT